MKRLLLALCVIAGPCFADDPETPRFTVNTTIRGATPGSTTHVASGGNLQTAINNASCGDKITLEAGATFTGNFTLPDKDCTDGNEVYITTDSASLPSPGTRVTPSDASVMAKITAATTPVIATASDADHYRLIGLEITTTAHITNIVRFDGGEGTANQNNHLIIDRCYIHGDATLGSRRGVLANGAYIAVIDSHISDIKANGADSQTIAAWKATGPIHIENNRLEASGENIMFGGADPNSATYIPSDIYVARNYLTKQLSWREDDGSYAGTPWTTKNLFELKNVQRILIEKNYFHINWAHSGGQSGTAMLNQVRNQDGTASFSTIQDVWYRGNVVRSASGAFKMLTEDDSQVSVPLARFRLEHTLVLDISLCVWGDLPSCAGDSSLFLITRGASAADDVQVEFNTMQQRATDHSIMFFSASNAITNLVYRYNIVQHSDSGFKIAGQTVGSNSINAGAPSAIVTENVFFDEASASSLYSGHTGNSFPATLAAVGFENTATEDFRLDAASSFDGVGPSGSDLGNWHPTAITAQAQLDWDVSIANSAYTTLVVDFGVPGLPADQSCTVRYGNQTVASTSGANTRQVIIEDLTPDQSYFVGVDCGDTWGGWLSFDDFTATEEPEPPVSGVPVLFSLRPTAALSTVARVTVECSVSVDMSSPVTNDADNFACTSAAVCSPTLADVPVGVNYCRHIYQTSSDVAVATSKPQQITIQ